MEDIATAHVLTDNIGNQNKMLVLLAANNALPVTDLQPANAIHAMLDGLY